MQTLGSIVGVKTQAPMQAPIAFTNAKKVIKDHQNLLIFFGVFVGAMGVLAATSKIFASAIGNLGDVHYWLHIICTTITVLCVYYIPTAVFWVHLPSKWIAHVIMCVSQIYCLSVLAIFRDFIDSPNSIIKNTIFKWTTRALLGGMGFISLFTLHKAVISLCYLFAILTVLGISIYSFFKSKENPRLFRFITAESIVLLGLFLLVLHGLGLVGSLFYFAFAISICIEQAIFINGLILRARKIQIEKTELLLSEIKARRDKEDANSKHISRLSLLLTLSRDLHMAKNAKDAMDIARQFTEKELGADFDMHSFFFESPTDDVQVKADKIFAKHIFEQLNSAIDSIESNARQLEIETTRIQEKYDLEKENLKNIVQISDQLNSPLMSLSMLVGKMLSINTNEDSNKDSFFEIWKKSRNIIESSLNLIIKASKNLSEMREKYANIEATSTFEGGESHGR